MFWDQCPVILLTMKLLLTLLLTFSCAQMPGTLPSKSASSSEAQIPTEEKGPAFKTEHPRICLNANRDKDISIIKLLEKDGYKVVGLKRKMLIKNLATCNILYVTSPLDRKHLTRQTPLTDQEVIDIHAWVKRGGALLLVQSSGKLMNKFRVFLRKLRPLTNTDLFPISENLMDITSPVVLGRNENERLHNIYYVYVNALKGPEYADVFLKTGEKFFRAAGLALKLGRGRVVMYSDAYIFTSNLDKKLKEETEHDNNQMALNTFHWLSNLL